MFAGAVLHPPTVKLNVLQIRKLFAKFVALPFISGASTS